jgi:hypothetical protein
MLLRNGGNRYSRQKKRAGETVFSVRSVPRCYKQDNLELFTCERVTGQQGREQGRCGNYGDGSRYQATTDEDIGD